jgi:MFS family permease
VTEPAARETQGASSGGGTFRSLRVYNFRVWSAGSIVSNVGTWMQRTAQDWLVLAELTHKNATAVGTVMACQFGPQLLLLPFTGYAADRFNQRRLLYITQGVMGLLAFGLGVLTITHLVQLWHVYVFAFLLGCAAAFDAPARQTFVGQLVGKENLSNAVGLNSTSFNSARLVGPAVAGVLIARVGTGWVFLLNGISFVAVLISLTFLRKSELQLPVPRTDRKKGEGGFLEGLRYVAARPDLRTPLVMVFFIGTFGLNFPIFISTMSVSVFHAGAGQFGLLTSMMAIGSVTAALLVARRGAPTLMLLLQAALLFGIGCALAAIMPSYLLFGLALILVGVSVQSFTTSTNALLQMSSAPSMRGRVVSIFLAIALGSTPLGAPLVGWVADRFGPRWAMGVAAASGVVAALIGVRHLVRHRNLRVRRRGRGVHFVLDEVQQAAIEHEPAE